MANNNHFSLTLDTLAPTGSISRSTQFVNTQIPLTIVKGDASFMNIWFDTNNSATVVNYEKATAYAKNALVVYDSKIYTVNTAITVEENTGWDAISAKMTLTVEVIPAADSYTSAFVTSGTYYYHLILEDSVGNRSQVYNTEVITYDIVKPTVDSVELKKRDGTSTEIVTTRDIAVEFTFSDNLSGAATCDISGDYNVTATGWVAALTEAEITAGKATRNIVLSGTGPEEATKTVSITVTDRAGNVATASSDTIYLDTIGLEGHIILRDSTDAKTITDTWVNVADFCIALDANNKTDWKGYKVWGDFNTDGSATTTSEPASYTDLTEAEKTAKRVLLARKFTSGDAAAKTVNAKIIDDSGNETTLTAVSAKVDYTAPSCSITCNKTYVSKVTGFTEAVFTPTTNFDISGAKGFQWYLNGSVFAGAGASGTGAPVALTVDSKDLGDGGEKAEKVFTLKVTDNAGNETTSTGVTLYLDTVAPAGTVSMSAWYNGDSADQTTYKKFSTAGATASATDAGAGMAFMTCWCSQIENDTTVTGTQIAYAENPTHANINWTGHGESATNYIHIEYVDAVGNKAIAHSAAFGIDTVVPTDGAVTFTQDAYPSTSASVTLTYSDVTSGVGFFKIWGDITSAATEDAATWEAIADSKSVTLKTPDGIKTVHVKYKDVAGNISVNAVNDSAELDTSKPSATLQLRIADDSDVKPAISNIATFAARITPTDDSTTDLQYKIYGDMNYGSSAAAQGITEEAAVWTDLVKVTGQDYALVSGLVCTTGDGTKNVYIKIKDNAGNVSDAVSQSFVYDTTAPEVTVGDRDFERVSKVNTKRHKIESSIVVEVDAYNDEVKFTFTPDSVCQAYKVCAYGTQALAEAGTHEDPAIPTTAGSTNMSATGIKFGPGQSQASISCMIKGADYETALPAPVSPETSKDGAHIVVVYVQDEAGTWSAAAQF